jgi:hypothetical protein
MRQVPDVVAYAQPGVNVFWGSLGSDYFGTSLASPLWAGGMALINEAVGQPSGAPGPALYALHNTSAFHGPRSIRPLPSVPGGGNDFTHVGLGSPNWGELAALLGARRASTATPIGTPTTSGSARVREAVEHVRRTRGRTGLAGVPVTSRLGDEVILGGALAGRGRVATGMAWTLTVPVPAGIAPGTLPVAVISTSVDLEGILCSPVVAGSGTASCAGTSVGLALQGSVVVGYFGPTATVEGSVSGPGPSATPTPAPLSLGAPPLPPPLLPPLPPPCRRYYPRSGRRRSDQRPFFCRPRPSPLHPKCPSSPKGQAWRCCCSGSWCLAPSALECVPALAGSPQIQRWDGPGGSLNRRQLAAPAWTTLDGSPARSLDSFAYSTRGTSRWMSIRSSNGPDSRFW